MEQCINCPKCSKGDTSIAAIAFHSHVPERTWRKYSVLARNATADKKHIERQQTVKACLELDRHINSHRSSYRIHHGANTATDQSIACLLERQADLTRNQLVESLLAVYFTDVLCSMKTPERDKSELK